MKADILLSNDTVWAIQVSRHEGRHQVILAGDNGAPPREMTVDFHDNAGVVTLKIEGKSYIVELSREGDRYAACIEEHRLECSLLTAEQRLRQRLDNDLGAKKKAIQAHMPGTVLKIFVKPGDQVAEGDKIAVIEAMKMEDTIQAPRDATIAGVQVSMGDSIQAGQNIVTFKDQA